MIKFRNSGKVISDFNIVEVEDKLAVKLPDGYKKFLMDQNGGKPSHNYIDLRSFDVAKVNTNIFVRIDRFFKLEEFQEVWLNTRKYLVGDELFPIAEFDGGMLLCVSFSAEKNGWVYYFDFGKIELCHISQLLDVLLLEEEVNYSKYNLDIEDPIEEEIVREDDMDSLKGLISDGFDFSKVIRGYDVRLIELAVIFIRVEMLKYIRESGSEFYDSLKIAEDNIDLFRDEGYDEIIAYIKDNS
jgi:hypothetical protein